VFVKEGTTYGKTFWTLVGDVTVDSTAPLWEEVPNGSGGITALTGDVTASGPGSSAATLATVNSNVGSFTNANITVDGKGRITAAANGSGSTLPTDFISGLLTSFVSTTEIQVGSGTAYNPNSSSAQTVSGAITDTYSYSSQTDLTINASNKYEVSSASHPFTANDIGSTISITAGTSWTTGIYIILTVDGSGNAYLNKSPSAITNTNKGTYTLELTASVLYGIFLSSATSIVIQGPLQLVDLAIDASNNKLVSSAAFIFTTAMVGQYIDITAGTSWTAGYYLIQSVSGGKATLTTSPSAAGNANLATASMSMIPYGGSHGNYQGMALQSIDGNTYRYLGAVLTTSANLFTNFTSYGVDVYYITPSTVVPFKPVNGGSGSAVSVNCGSIVPPNSIVAYMQATLTGSPGGTAGFGNSSSVPTSTAGIWVSITPTEANSSGPMGPFPLNQTQQFEYSTSGGTSISVYVYGYKSQR
jgi:hypothetical protein